MLRNTGLFAIALMGAGPLLAADPDADGCKDFFVSRMVGYSISECTQSDFDSFIFAEQQTVQTEVQGKIVNNTYTQPDGATPNSPLKVRQNYLNALQGSGWTIVFNDIDLLVAKQVKNGQERWVQLDDNGGSFYKLHLAQKAGMQQSVVTADDMGTALNRDGRISLHINFDTGNAAIKPDSLPIIDQIVALMKGAPSLKLGVEGNTDNVGNPQSNQTLSQARAQAVVTAVTKAGIDASRLSALGNGQNKPVADNGTEEGRAQNRRVDLIKK
jgi:outer membrane protein OmpA-like peptidoglycan-associated protein